MRKSLKRAVVTGAVLAITAGAGTAAYAAWLAKGEGSAYQKATTAKDLVVKVASPSADLYPGAKADAFLEVENPNKYPVTINKVSWKKGPNDKVTATGGTGTCNNTGIYFGDFRVSNQDRSNGVRTDVSVVVEAGKTVKFTVPDAVRMINNVEDGCQGATFSIPVSVTGESSAN